MKINAAVISRPGAGKASLLSCIYNSALPGFSMKLPVKEDFNPVDKAYKALQEWALLKKDGFTVNMQGHQDSSGMEDRVVLLEGEGGELSFCFTGNTENARIFIAVIDTPIFMNKDSRRLSGIIEAQKIFLDSLKDSEDNKMLLIVPVKSEAYMRHESSQLMNEMKSALGETLETMRAEYRGRSAVAVLPVNTIGGAVFSNFVYENGTITGETFRRVKNVNFKPEHSEQVLSFIANFLLHETAIISKKDMAALKKLASYADFSASNSEILYGHKLIEPEQEKEPESLFKRMRKYLIAACVLIALTGGLYFVNSHAAQKIAESNSKIEENNLRANEMISTAQMSEHAALRKTEEIEQTLNKIKAELAAANSYVNFYKELAENLEKELSRKDNELRKVRDELKNVKNELDKVKSKSWWPF